MKASRASRRFLGEEVTVEKRVWVGEMVLRGNGEGE